MITQDFDIKLIDQLVNQVCEELKADIREKPVTQYGAFYASGRLEASIRYEVTVSEIAIFGEDYYKAGEQGNPQGTRVSPAKIREWLKHKNIAYKKGLEYAISNSIFQKGTVIFRQGGNTGLFSDTIGKDSFFVRRVEDELNSMASHIMYNTALTLIL